LPSGRDQSPEAGGIDWLAVLRILLIQLLVLVALSAAVVRYVDWSSEQAWAEFIAAGPPSPPHGIRRPPRAMPVEEIKRKMPCEHGA
jgi:hypothetical protein